MAKNRDLGIAHDMPTDAMQALSDASEEQRKELIRQMTRPTLLPREADEVVAEGEPTHSNLTANKLEIIRRMAELNKIFPDDDKDPTYQHGKLKIEILEALELTATELNSSYGLVGTKGKTFTIADRLLRGDSPDTVVLGFVVAEGGIVDIAAAKQGDVAAVFSEAKEKEGKGGFYHTLFNQENYGGLVKEGYVKYVTEVTEIQTAKAAIIEREGKEAIDRIYVKSFTDATQLGYVPLRNAEKFSPKERSSHHHDHIKQLADIHEKAIISEMVRLANDAEKYDSLPINLHKITVGEDQSVACHERIERLYAENNFSKGNQAIIEERVAEGKLPVSLGLPQMDFEETTERSGGVFSMIFGKGGATTAAHGANMEERSDQGKPNKYANIFSTTSKPAAPSKLTVQSMQAQTGSRLGVSPDAAALSQEEMTDIFAGIIRPIPKRRGDIAPLDINTLRVEALVTEVGGKTALTMLWDKAAKALPVAEKIARTTAVLDKISDSYNSVEGGNAAIKDLLMAQSDKGRTSGGETTLLHKLHDALTKEGVEASEKDAIKGLVTKLAGYFTADELKRWQEVVPESGKAITVGLGGNLTANQADGADSIGEGGKSIFSGLAIVGKVASAATSSSKVTTKFVDAKPNSFVSQLNGPAIDKGVVVRKGIGMETSV